MYGTFLISRDLYEKNINFHTFVEHFSSEAELKSWLEVLLPRGSSCKGGKKHSWATFKDIHDKIHYIIFIFIIKVQKCYPPCCSKENEPTLFGLSGRDESSQGWSKTDLDGHPKQDELNQIKFKMHWLPFHVLNNST